MALGLGAATKAATSKAADRANPISNAPIIIVLPPVQAVHHEDGVAEYGTQGFSPIGEMTRA
jgi:hypothetical protein